MIVPLPEAEARLRGMKSNRLYAEVLEGFRAAFPDCREVGMVRAPGRVNIIGEHTDYNGLPVMPMAIDREIVVAFAPRGEPEVEMVSVDPTFPPIRFAVSDDIPRYETGHWGNYVKAAVQAVWRWTAEHSPSSLPLPGIRGCVGGDIPPGAGLSSSSALVVASALPFALDLGIGKPELADLLAKGERYVGTEGGGMDQAVSIMAAAGSALKIDFFPLRARAVTLPRDHVIVVANSMVSANKTGAARVAYNTRVAECKLGLEMLKRERPEAANAVLLRDFMVSVPDWREALDAMPDDPCFGAESKPRSIDAAGDVEFQPKKRCRHVLTEGMRVERAAEAAERGDARALGALMDQSHESCARDYEISCPELDELVASMRRSGALGARLTGAGFGGCAVALVHSDKANELTDGVWRDYYGGYLSSRGVRGPEDRVSVLFACVPVAGAGSVL